MIQRNIGKAKQIMRVVTSNCEQIGLFQVPLERNSKIFICSGVGSRYFLVSAGRMLAVGARRVLSIAITKLLLS